MRRIRPARAGSFGILVDGRLRGGRGGEQRNQRNGRQQTRSGDAGTDDAGMEETSHRAVCLEHAAETWKPPFG